jgi:hypothetical protein
MKVTHRLLNYWHCLSNRHSCSGAPVICRAVLLPKNRGDNLKKLFFIFLPLIVMQSCNTNEPDHSMVSPLTAFKIDSLQISGKQVTATVTYTI